jgi:3-oxoacyl-[acyl-carrier-protein] synthase-1
MKSLPLSISAYSILSALGSGVTATWDAIAAGRSGLRANDFPGCDLDTWIGRVSDSFLEPLPGELEGMESRNNRLTLAGLQADNFLQHAHAAVQRFGAERVGVVIGTSTSSIGRTEEGYTRLLEDGSFPPAWVQPDVQNPHSPGHLAAIITGAAGPNMTIGTACSSSAKVFASAARWLHAGLVDAVIVGGVDSLCLSVLYGFNSLQLVSTRPCRPFDAARDGISIGEAAGFALVTRPGMSDGECYLAGFGESSDAHHMSSPHPDGLGAEMAVREALARARLSAADIGYVNLHGTATRANDQVEAGVLARCFPKTVVASSTKGWTGHTLGAAGIVEAVITIESIRRQMAPRTLNAETLFPDCPAGVLTANRALATHAAMSNSFGFGGSNCALVFSLEQTWN